MFLELKPVRIMTQEEKQLLVTDLCARLPYGVKIYTTLYGAITLNEILIRNFRNGNINALTPYLRPMSSMTDIEAEEYTYLLNLQDEFSTDLDIQFKVDLFDWLNAHHFDYRGLIEKGLALEAPEGMYDLKEK